MTIAFNIGIAVFHVGMVVSAIKILKDSDLYNAKSMMSILSMGASKGTALSFQIEGNDEKEALEEIKEIIDNNFGE